MKKRCYEDKDNKLILDNKELFDYFLEKNNVSNINIDDNLMIIIPVTINICLTNSKYSIDFIKYSKHIINVLNEGFSGKIRSKYKSPEYSEMFFSIIANNNHKHGKIIYEYINYKFDSNIRFKLDSIVYHNKNFETQFTNADTELLIENFFKQGFIIGNDHKNNLHINIIKFNCSTLGVSTFPWSSIIHNPKNFNNYMQVFVDYKTIHPDLSSSNFNNSRTIIHEVGHIFGLRHIFNGNKESLDTYKILLGEKFFNDIFDICKYNQSKYINKELTLLETKIYSDNLNNLQENNNLNNTTPINMVTSEVQNVIGNIFGINNKTNDINIYPDIIGQEHPTTKNPIEKKKFIIKDDIPVNFACFMDYSPDEVLTHFTLSQCKIMRAIIYIYKNYLICGSINSNQHNYSNKKIKLYLPSGYFINFKNNNKFTLSSTSLDLNQFIYPLIFKDGLEYYIKNKPKIVEK